MPEIGEIRKGQEIGRKDYIKYVWLACKNCGKERWLQRTETLQEKFTNFCPKCNRSLFSKQYFKDKRIEGYILKPAQDLGLKSQAYYYFDTCPKCKKQLWRQKIMLGKLCKQCTHEINRLKLGRGENSIAWKGGRCITNTGYVKLILSLNSPYISTARKISHRNSYEVLEHRLVMAQHLGRSLEHWETVHHINGNRQDNRIENLELLPKPSEHDAYTRMQNYIKELETRIATLEARNTLIEAELALARV